MVNKSKKITPTSSVSPALNKTVNDEVLSTSSPGEIIEPVIVNQASKSARKKNKDLDIVKPKANGEKKIVKPSKNVPETNNNVQTKDKLTKSAGNQNKQVTGNTVKKSKTSSNKSTKKDNVSLQASSSSTKSDNKINQGNTRKENSGHNKSKHKQSNARKPSDAFITMGQTPKSKIFATKKFPIINRIVHSNLSQLSIIGQNLAGINGGLLRYRALEGIEPFENYIQTLITNVNTSILTEIAECQEYLNKYKEQGYDFISASEPAICQVKLFNSTSNLLIELYLYLDTLITQINYLEKCNHISTSDKIKIERQWSMLPRHLNSRILGLKAAIEKKLKVNLSKGNDGQIHIDVKAVKGLFEEFTKNKSQLTLTYMPPIPVMQNIYENTSHINEKLA